MCFYISWACRAESHENWPDETGDPRKSPLEACDLTNNEQLGVFCFYPSGILGTSQCLKGAYRKL